MQKRTKVFITLIILVIIISAFLYWQFNIYQPAEYYARQHWNDICEKIDSGMVISSIITDDDTGQQEINIENCLSPEDFDWFLDKEISPPTPYYTITIKFSDNSEVSLHNWDSVDFSVYHRERYYIFVNDELFRRIEAIYGNTQQ